MADWTKSITMHDWATMRTTWQKKRDSFHVPKGAGGLSLGDAIKAVEKAQPNGLKPFVLELTKFEAKLTKYTAAIVKKGAKPPKNPKDPNYKALADWIHSDFEAWIKADKQAAKNESKALQETFDDFVKAIAPLRGQYRAELSEAELASAKAQGAASTDGLPFVKEDVKRVTTVLQEVTTALDDIIALCAAAKKGYGTAAPQGVVTALSGVEDQAKDVHEFLAELTQQSNWDDVLVRARSMEARFRSLMEEQSLVVKAVRARVGS